MSGEEKPHKKFDTLQQDWKIFTENNEVKLFKSDSEDKWKSPWYFIQGADPQYGLIQRYINKKADQPDWSEENKLTEKLAQKINLLNPKPRFFIVCGDLCDAVATSEPELFKGQEYDFKRIFSKIDPSIPVLVTCGNHDVGDSPTPENLEIYRKSWGDDYYSFWCGGIFFIVINTQYFMDPQHVTQYAKEHQIWLEQQLKLAKSKENTRVIMLQHVPWFLKSADEAEIIYFSVSKEVRDELLEKLVDAGVQKVFCGHLHRNAGGEYKSMEVVISSAIGGQLGPDKSGIRLVKVYGNRIEHQYYAIEDIPVNVEM